MCFRRWAGWLVGTIVMEENNDKALVLHVCGFCRAPQFIFLMSTLPHSSELNACSEEIGIDSCKMIIANFIMNKKTCICQDHQNIQSCTKIYQGSYK